jgi:hypothetical protein
VARGHPSTGVVQHYDPSRERGQWWAPHYDPSTALRRAVVGAPLRPEYSSEAVVGAPALCRLGGSRGHLVLHRRGGRPAPCPRVTRGTRAETGS